MKVLGIVGSPRKGGNTEILVREALDEVQKAGGETEIFLVAENNVAPCDGCGACFKNNVCVIKDDMQKLYQQLLAADGVIFGSPVYYGNVSAQAKAIMDRTYAFMTGRKLGGKVAGAIVTARRVGAGQVRTLMYSFFASQRMIIATGGIGYGRMPGEVKTGVGGAAGISAIDEARDVGKSVVSLVERLSKSK